MKTLKMLLSRLLESGTNKAARTRRRRAVSSSSEVDALECRAMMTGNIFYVGLTGSNNNPGTLESPFATVEKASSVVQPGDTVRLLGGTYRNASFGDGNVWKDGNDQVFRIVGVNGTAEEPITFEPNPGDHVKLQFDGNGGVRINQSTHVRFRGFEIEGPGETIRMEDMLPYQFAYRLPNDDTIYYRDPAATLTQSIASLGGYKPNYFNSNGLAIGNGSDHIEIVDNIVHGAPGYGISSLGGAEYLSIINNEVYSNSWWAGGNHGISVQNIKSKDTYDGFKVIIQGNELKDNYARTISWATLKKDPVAMTIDEGKGIHLQENTTADGFLHGRILIANNTVVNSGRAGIAENLSERVTIVNNTLVNNAYANTLFAMGMLDPKLPADFLATDGGVRLQGGDDIEIYNNLIVVSAGASAVAGSQGQSSDDATAGSNFYVGALATNNHAAFLSAGFTQISDAGFVDPMNGNFELRYNSAAVDVGNTSFVTAIAVQTSTGLASDIDGDSRIYGGSIDVGAQENSLAFNPSAQTAIRDQLLSGVNRIADQGDEGTIAVLGDDATSILQDPDQRTVVAAADNGSARIVAAAKTGFVNFNNASLYDTARFYNNTIQWLSHGQGTSARIVTDISAARTWLLSQGYTNVSVRTDWENGLGNADVLVTAIGNPSAVQQTALNAFLADGNGLFAGYNGWAYGSGVTPLNSGGNAVLRHWGLSWTDSVAWTFDGVIHKGTAFGNAVLADEILRNSSLHTTAQHNEMAAAVVSAFSNVPPEDSRISDIRNDIVTNASTLIPTPANGVSSATDRALLRIEAAALVTLPADDLFEHRTAFSYGAIPDNASRVTETRSYTINAANTASQWLSTGLYAAPGDVVTLTVPANLVDAGWEWKIGSHDDDNSNVTTYNRMPTGISRDVAIDATTIRTGSVYGGMIYLVKPATSAGLNVTYQVQIANALKAPAFILGETTDADWVATIRNYPAPQTELISNNLIISMHSSDTRALTNPASVMTYWNDIVAVQDHLVNAPAPRTRAERIDDDLQISAGWMHAGYPIAAYANNLVNMIDSDPSDDWGFFHELGHNHQSSHWTFSGEGEITVNILSMRSYDSLGTVPADNWSGMWTDAGRAARIPAFIAGGRARSDAANSLVAYAQLRAGFGWEAFEQFFRSYQTDASTSLPKTDQQERDQWVTRFSNVVGRNLGPFFKAWGFNPSQAALDAVSGLPMWTKIEAVSPDSQYFTNTAQPVTFDPRSLFVDVIGGTMRLSFDAPDHGTLTSNADCSVTYTPNTGWNGYETLNFSVRNDFGGIASGTATILTGARVTTATAADAFIAEANPNTNYGTASTLLVDGSPLRQGLLQFSSLFGSGAGQIPERAEIVSATLSINVTDGGTSLNFHRMLRPWNATTATWNTMISGIQTDGIEAVATPDLSTGAVSTGVRTFDVTTSLAAWNANPNTNFGWVILPTSSNGVDIASAESATPPILSIEYFVPPQQDTTAPVAVVQPLPMTTSTKSITLNVSLSDQLGSGDTFASGVANYDLYVAVDQGDWTLLASEVPATQTEFHFIPDSNRRYWFRADARDVSGNVEQNLYSEANTMTTDVDAPTTEVVAASPDATGLFTLTLRGSDAGDSTLAAFRVYVRVDDTAAVEIPLSNIASGTASSEGVYTATTTFQGLRDEQAHTYTFFTRGVDQAGNFEDSPASSTADLQQTHLFHPPVSLTARGIDVQNGETQRSYVRYVDVLFNDSAGLQDLFSNGRIQVEKFSLTSTNPTQGTGSLVAVSGGHVQGNSLQLDFGSNGIGGSADSGNGFYRIALDLDGDGLFDDARFEFFRLWGDSNGDGTVDLEDRIVTEDLDGDGVISARDRKLYRSQFGKRLLPLLISELDD